MTAQPAQDRLAQLVLLARLEQRDEETGAVDVDEVVAPDAPAPPMWRVEQLRLEGLLHTTAALLQETFAKLQLAQAELRVRRVLDAEVREKLHAAEAERDAVREQLQQWHADVADAVEAVEQATVDEYGDAPATPVATPVMAAAAEAFDTHFAKQDVDVGATRAPGSHDDSGWRDLATEVADQLEALLAEGLSPIKQ